MRNICKISLRVVYELSCFNVSEKRSLNRDRVFNTNSMIHLTTECWSLLVGNTKLKFRGVKVVSHLRCIVFAQIVRKQFGKLIPLREIAKRSTLFAMTVQIDNAIYFFLTINLLDELINTIYLLR